MTNVTTREMTDPSVWLSEMQTGILPEDQNEHYPRFNLRVPIPGDDQSGTLVLARGRHVSLSVSLLAAGSGEPNQRCFDDEAAWLVLAGEATFETGDSREVSRLNASQGIFVPKGVPYAFRNDGDGLSVMLRGGGRKEPVEAYRDFYTGPRPGGTEGISWRRDLWAGVDEHPGGAQRFNLRFPVRTENTPPWRPLARGGHLALHASGLEPGRGEVNLHSHDDEAAWVILYGEATFWGEEENVELGILRANDGILIPRDAPYRYENTGDGYLMMLRFGGRGTPVPTA